MSFRLVRPFADRISSSDLFANPTPDFLWRCQRNPTCSILMSVTPAILPMARVDLGETDEPFCEASQTSVDLTIRLHFYDHWRQTFSLSMHICMSIKLIYECMNIGMCIYIYLTYHMYILYKQTCLQQTCEGATVSQIIPCTHKNQLIHHQWQKSWLMADGNGKQLCGLRDLWDDILLVFRPLKPFNIGSQAHQYQQLRPPVATKDHP